MAGTKPIDGGPVSEKPPNGELPGVDAYAEDAARYCGKPTKFDMQRASQAFQDAIAEHVVSDAELNTTLDAEAQERAYTPPARSVLAINAAEIETAELTPDCIVRDYLYADVAQLIAPGGVGKTTLVLHESIQIALGRDVWGLEVVKQGATLIVTAEDQRERLVARFREICKALNLSGEDLATAMAGLLIWDVTGADLKLIQAEDGNIRLTELADNIVSAFSDAPPVVVIFDPLVSFGVGEDRINGNEQGCVMAARRIMNGLNCCVRFIHPTGKGNAREKTDDQYSGRGGSALADGSRMTAVAHSWQPGEKPTPPQACEPGADVGIVRLSRPKLSYSPPNLPRIWLRRTGFSYESFIEEPPPSVAEKAAQDVGDVLQFVIGQLMVGRKHSKSSLDALTDQIGDGLTRKELRAAIATLMSSGGLYQRELPEHQRHGQLRSFLMPSRDAVALASPHLADKIEAAAVGGLAAD